MCHCYGRHCSWAKAVRDFGIKLLVLYDAKEVTIWPMAFEYMDHNYQWTRDLVKELVNTGAIMVVQATGNIEDSTYQILPSQVEDLIIAN